MTAAKATKTATKSPWKEPEVLGGAISAGGTLIGAGVQTWGNIQAAKIQGRENMRIERLRIKFANEESGREMYRYQSTLDENKRQFGRDLEFRGKQLEQNESQFVRTNALNRDQLNMSKKDMNFRNKMAVKQNMQNLLATNHEMRMNMIKIKLSKNGRS